MRRKFSYDIGIDEVGRGPLAGPVCVCALALSTGDGKKLKAQIRTMKLADSKKLTEAQRDGWAAWVSKEGIAHAISCAAPATIDKIRIHNAVNRAAQRAYRKVRTKCGTVSARVVADGNILIHTDKRDIFEHFPKADELMPAVSLASIVAKVYRDRRMKRLHGKYAAYGFGTNKGYGTKEHIMALRKKGPSSVHRLTFIRAYHKIR